MEQLTFFEELGILPDSPEALCGNSIARSSKHLMFEIDMNALRTAHQIDLRNWIDNAVQSGSILNK